MARLRTCDGIWLDVPFRTVLRLWLRRRINLTATWLVIHVHWRAGKLLWQLCGMW